MSHTTTSPLRDMYERHHRDRERHSGKMHTDERGKYLRAAVGIGKRVIDIGCRNGVLTSFVVDGNTVTGVDIDESALAEAGANLGIETRAIDLNGEWPLPEKSYDAAVATEVLEHLYFPESAVKKTARLLTENGLFVGSVPNAFSLINRLRLLLGKKDATPLADPTHITHFSRSELKEMLERHFEEVIIDPLGNYAWLDRYFPGYFSFMLLFTAKRPRRAHNKDLK
jgi:2-polyprenyl-3-methyl-5-hydroxy-6-metoxy-1,4-benzoquinol methylase